MHGYGTRTPGPRRNELTLALGLAYSFFCAPSPVNPRLPINLSRWKDVLFTVPFISTSYLPISSTSLGDSNHLGAERAKGLATGQPRTQQRQPRSSLTLGIS